MTKGYEVWFRDPLSILENQIANPDFVGHVDYAPKELKDRNGQRLYVDLMSGEWAWNQAVSSYFVRSITMLTHFPFSLEYPGGVGS